MVQRLQTRQATVQDPLNQAKLVAQVDRAVVVRDRNVAVTSTATPPLFAVVPVRQQTLIAELPPDPQLSVGRTK